MSKVNITQSEASKTFISQDWTQWKKGKGSREDAKGKKEEGEMASIIGTTFLLDLIAAFTPILRREGSKM